MNLLAERLNRGLSARALAEQIGVSEAIVLRAEAGFGVRPVHAKKIADFYSVKVTDLWPVEDRTSEVSR